MSDVLSKIFDADQIDQQSDRRAQWAVVLKGATLFTSLAIKAKDAAKTAQGHQIMSKARANAGLDSAILSAIFGGEVPAVPENRLMAALAEAGQTATKAELEDAREVIAEWQKAEEAAKAERMAKAKAERAKENLAYSAKIDAAIAATEARRQTDIQTVTFTADFTQEDAIILGSGEKVGLIGYARKKSNFWQLAELARHNAKLLGLPSSNAGALPVRFRSELRGVATYVVDETILDNIKASLAAEKAEKAEALAAEKAVQAEKAEAKAKAEKEVRVAALLAAGGIEVDGIILTEDGREIKLEDV